MTAAHLLRPGAKRRKAAPPLPAKTYPAGFFTELMRQHCWPPMFEPQMAATSNQDASRADNARKGMAMRAGFSGASLNLAGAAEHVERWKGRGT